MELSAIISTSIDKFTRRLIKVRRFGNDDVQEPFQANNAGIDSNPIKDMVAVYSSTSENGKNVIIGYLNKNQIADSGEVRIYSTDENGQLKTFVWVTNEGKIELGGVADNAVMYSKLNGAINEALTGLVPQLQIELTKIAAGIAAGGGSYTPGTLSCDLSESKSDIVQIGSNTTI